MVKTKLYIIRHAEAEGNLYRRAHGWYDSRLTKAGIEQVKRLAGRMESEIIDVLYSSDVRRTVLTAGAVSYACNIDIKQTDTLRERSMGNWEDMPWSECMRLNPLAAYGFGREIDSHPPEGESLLDLYERVSSALMGILERHEGKSVCVVSHATAIGAMLAFILYGDICEYRNMKEVGNASVSLVEYENGKFVPVYINDITHIEGVRKHRARLPEGFEGKAELWFRSVDGKADVQRAIESWKNSWIAVHGSDAGFSDDSAESEIKRMLRVEKNAVRFAMLNETIAGTLLLDTANYEEDGCGHISLVMLNDEFRGYGLAPQLLGEAVSYYRARGRTKLRLHVSATNKRALRFYLENDFVVTKKEDAYQGEQYTMKKEI